MTLPTSYQMAGALSFTGEAPIAFGGFGDAYRGTLGTSTAICIKRIRITSIADKEMLKQVRHQFSPRPDLH